MVEVKIYLNLSLGQLLTALTRSFEALLQNCLYYSLTVQLTLLWHEFEQAKMYEAIIEGGENMIPKKVCLIYTFSMSINLREFSNSAGHFFHLLDHHRFVA